MTTVADNLDSQIEENGNMPSFQFTCAVRIEAPGTDWDGELYVIPNLVTPPVTCNTPTEAFTHPDTVEFCLSNKCRIYERVRSWDE